MHRAPLIIAALLCGCGSNEPEAVQDSIDWVINDDHLPDDDVNSLCQRASDVLRSRLPVRAIIDVRQAVVDANETGWSVLLIYDIGNDRRTCIVMLKPLNESDPSPRFATAVGLQHSPILDQIDFHAQR